MKIREMKNGERGRVSGYDTDDRNYRQKLLRMGLIRGAEFTLVRLAPLGDPAEILISGSSLTLRKAEADALIVEKI
ncbi:MAG: ferrous iron transport protein A [Kiritimatiellaceae bacterium]|nr:ferrous iron transport protein A [Kiritimatiellaceae bacterium]